VRVSFVLVRVASFFGIGACCEFLLSWCVLRVSFVLVRVASFFCIGACCEFLSVLRPKSNKNYNF
jgi:hypothetical protein